MSSTYTQYYQYPDQNQIFLAANSYGYGQQDGEREKSPASMINHPGHSPGPLSTPPMSRNPSQPPEQAPDHMVWDEVDGSCSDSPTSARTPPDNEAFGFEMLDASEAMPTLYNQNGNVAMVSTQIGQEPILAVDSTLYFSDQALQDTYNAVAAQAQAQQYHASFNQQSQPPQNMLSSQPFNQFYSQNYTSQPAHHDPWTSQRPQQNPNVPRSGGVVFDPETDPHAVDYTQYVNLDVNQWTHNNTDPNYLISPNEPAQGNLFNFAAQNQRLHHHHRPLEMRVTVPSPPPGSHTFVNYNQSTTYFGDDYATNAQYSPSSPGTSAMGSSVGQIPHSPFQVAISPQASMPSPGGSEGIFSSYQHSDPGMMVDSYTNEQYDAKPAPPASPVQVEPSPSRSVPEGTFETSPDPDVKARLQPAMKGSGRPGGRALGTHLEPKVAKAAHDMRKIVACWHCVLQRDKCGPGDICERCVKRSQRPNADCGLGCSRVKLIELAESFLPTLVMQIHEDAHLKHFVTQFIRQWSNVEITVYMTCGQDNMPRIPVKVYEFLPNGEDLLVQYQYVVHQVTHERIRVKKQSPALGMVHINHNEEKKYDKYISDIVDHHLDAFGELCWMEDDNDFQQKLFRLMTRVKPKSEDEAKLLREVFRLMVVTFIMSHTLTIAEDTKHTSLSKMHSYQGPSSYVENFCSPRMTNRQLKYFFARLHRSILSTVLNKLQQIFKSSKGCDKWLAAFVAVIGMCMAHEDQQKTIHLVMETKATTEGWDLRDAQARADIACREIDERTSFIAQIFRWKYNRKCNPLRDADYAWDREIGFGDETSVTFVRQVAQLVKENIDFLTVRQSVSISSANQTKYTSRLVGQFLLSFWLPS